MRLWKDYHTLDKRLLLEMTYMKTFNYSNGFGWMTILLRVILR